MIARFKRWLAAKLTPFVVRNGPNGLQAKINERALELAVPVVMAAMDKAGLQHCHICPNKRGPLRNLGGFMACPRHLVEVQRMADEAKAAA